MRLGILGKVKRTAGDDSNHCKGKNRKQSPPQEWPQAQTLSSLIVRYFDGKMVRGPAVVRTQPWARLQSWEENGWKDLEAQIFGEENSVVHYIFPAVTTTRIRLLFTEPPDPEGRRFPDALGIYVCELEAYRDVPFQWVSAPGRLVQVLPGGDEDRNYLRHFNEPPPGDGGYNIAGPLIIEPKQTRIFTDTLTSTFIVSESRWAQQPCDIQSSPLQVTQLSNGFLQVDISTEGELRETG